ncbi:four-carbon acid sugar kinase family protein [Pelosinus sp. sgz500959]|uniref:four-carbon acid sugar kinase family protein n=1 Tax=Pelosinus sp. sgz500959 TaxID=3242472 RepID=UPI0036703278
MPKLLVIADDLTGANDTGVQFSKFGLQTIVLLGSERAEALVNHADILVLDTDSRAEASFVAAKRVTKACKIVEQLDIPHLYKKIDSTLRGNIKAEISAACTAFKPMITVIAPAFPNTCRVTIGGHQLLEGMPISMTEIAHDPKTPVTESWIPHLLSREDGKVGIIPLEKVMGGSSVIYEEIIKHVKLGEDWLVFDAVTEENLRDIAQAAAQFERVLWVGSAGLAQQLSTVLEWGKNEEKKSPLLSNHHLRLVVAGSVSAVTQKQIKTYIEKKSVPYILLDSVAAVLMPDQEIERIILAARKFLQEKDLVIYCSNDKEVVEEVIAAGKSIHIDSTEVGIRIAMVLGQVVAQLGKEGLAGLFLTGGETAVSSCRTLQATGIEILQEVVSGIPVGKLIGGPLHGLNVITKAGAFGNEYAIIEAMKFFEN